MDFSKFGAGMEAAPRARFDSFFRRFGLRLVHFGSFDARLTGGLSMDMMAMPGPGLLAGGARR